MKKILALSLLTLGIANSIFAQKAEDRKSIKDMCGCYEVTFNFIETFSPDTAYKNKKPYKTAGLEWITAIEDKPAHITLQHLLITPHAIVKHWRQDWTFENPNSYQYKTPGHWDYVTLPKASVKGQWSQQVSEVDDSPRYQASGTWIHADGRNYWETTTDAPLPRREYTKRSDYNVMRRTNHHEITKDGHIHDQYNWKINRTAEGDKLIVEETGLNTYKKVEDSKCKAAQDWWAKNHDFWDDVRAVWAEVQSRNKNLLITWRVEDKYLYERLFEMGDEYAKVEKKDSVANKEAIRKVFALYVDKEMSTVQQQTKY